MRARKLAAAAVTSLVLGGMSVALTMTSADQARAAGADETKSTSKAASSSERPPPPPLDEETLAAQDNIDVGKELWQKQCRHCHGRSAYPGKAPKLKPRRYKPDFVYDRVTYGFRKMPAWELVFDEQQRVGIVAFVMSKQFSP